MNSARILVVDDNPVNRKLACNLLELEGHTVAQAEDAPSALAVLAAGALPDLILMDIALPGMDGLTLTRQLRADPRYHAVPIVALTAFAMKGDEQKALAAGCDGYIAKPIDTRRFPGQVRAHLPEAGGDGSGGLQVMIVEDHRIDLRFAGESARMSGHVVLSSTSGEEALEQLQQARPDVVLLDLNLPGMVGVAFLRQVKTDPATRDLPVVAITAYPDDFTRRELEAAGVTAFLVKPIGMPDLVAALETAARVTAPR